MTLQQIQQCEYVANVVCWYRDHHSFINSACWMDEWVLGYVCALRDVGIVNAEQATFLFDAFQPEIQGNSELG